MRFLIAYPLGGEAAEYHTALSNQLAERFGLEPVAARIPPHLTLKAPFEAEDIGPIRELLAYFAQKETPEPIHLGGFEHFDGRVVFLDVEAPKRTHMQVRRLQDKLRGVSWLTFSRHEFPIRLHATLCYPKHPQQAKEVLHHLRNERALFDAHIDSIALFAHDSERWNVAEGFPLSGAKQR